MQSNLHRAKANCNCLAPKQEKQEGLLGLAVGHG
jgi:hypothetical protein